ncbi:hypothetical protein [Actinomadura napierensis]|uniref:Uncharacterized protein n=1 Tax=Actinomadura napierensis TaxID=267854 RepID=A0ABN2YJG3_9ACTN
MHPVLGGEAAERTVRHITAGFHPSRTRTLYEPAPFTVGGWVTVTTDDETLTGQMAADNVVIWMRDDGTTTCEAVKHYSRRSHERWYIRRRVDEEGAGPNGDHEAAWKAWELRLAAAPPTTSLFFPAPPIPMRPPRYRTSLHRSPPRRSSSSCLTRSSGAGPISTARS